MKLLLLPLFAFSILFIRAQHDYPNCKDTYFKNGKISTSKCFDKNNRFGKARAYNQQGQKIYERELRTVGGHSSVSFTFYKTGAVQKAEWRSAPDGGIQWYSNITTFAEDGTQLSSVDNNYDDRLTIPYTQVPNQKPAAADTVKPTLETMACAVIYSNEIWYINHSPHKIIITAVRNKDEFFTTLVSKGESIKGGAFILAQQYDTPEKYFSFSVQPLNPKVKQQFAFTALPELTNTIKEGVRRYYYEIK